jgi:hypothetical protein
VAREVAQACRRDNPLQNPTAPATREGTCRPLAELRHGRDPRPGAERDGGDTVPGMDPPDDEYRSPPTRCGCTGAAPPTTKRARGYTSARSGSAIGSSKTNVAPSADADSTQSGRSSNERARGRCTARARSRRQHGGYLDQGGRTSRRFGPARRWGSRVLRPGPRIELTLHPARRALQPSASTCRRCRRTSPAGTRSSRPSTTRARPRRSRRSQRPRRSRVRRPPAAASAASAPGSCRLPWRARRTHS